MTDPGWQLWTLADDHDTADPAACWCEPFRMESGLWIHQDERVPRGHGVVFPAPPPDQPE